MARKAFVLCSGGLDSVTVAYYVKSKGMNPILLFIDYGQRTLKEEEFCVRKAAEALGAEVKKIDLRWLGKISGSLLNNEDLGKGLEKVEEVGKRSDEERVAAWNVPCRNALFLMVGLAHAESSFLDDGDVYIGIKYEGEISFKDTSPEFVEKMNEVARVMNDSKGKIIAPFLEKDKEEIIEIAGDLGVLLEFTYSCYVGKGFREEKLVHCGKCDACAARRKGFRFANLEDVSVYEN